MPTLSQWLHLPRADKLGLLAAGWRVVTFRLALWLLPLRLVLRLARRMSHSRKPIIEPGADEIACATRSIRRAARFVPRATCLTQALSLHALLGRQGIATELRIGVAKTPAGHLLAHAWLERDGATVASEDLSSYLPFPPIQLGPANRPEAVRD